MMAEQVWGGNVSLVFKYWHRGPAHACAHTYEDPEKHMWTSERLFEWNSVIKMHWKGISIVLVLVKYLRKEKLLSFPA